MSTVSKRWRPCLQDCRLGSAMESMCVGLVVMNPAGRIRWLNRTASNCLGLDLDRCEGRLLSSVIKDPRLAEFWHQAMRSEGKVLCELSMLLPAPAELKVNATVSRDPAGEAMDRILLFCDVTAEKTVQVSLSQAAAEKLIDMAGDTPPTNSPIASLTPQELRVLRRVGEGKGNQEIASEIYVAVSTVRSHMKQIYRKTGLASRAEAIRFALQNRLA